MPDYKEMCLKMFRASEKALDMSIAAQQECERIHTESSSPGFKIAPCSMENNQTAGQELAGKGAKKER